LKSYGFVVPKHRIRLTDMKRMGIRIIEKGQSDPYFSRIS